MKLTVKMQCWDGDKIWFETNTFEGPNYYEIDDQIFNHLDWSSGFVVEDYEVLEAAE
jgi:hypothetical protein